MNLSPMQNETQTYRALESLLHRQIKKTQAPNFPIESRGVCGFLRPQNSPMGPPRNWRAILVQKI